MKDLIEEIEKIEKRYKEVEEVFAKHDFSQNSDFQQHSKEFGTLEKNMPKIKAYRKVEAQIKEAQKLTEEGDSEIKELALQELETLNATKINLEKELEDQIIGVSPLLEKSAFMEIRAGAGGDEASLFAAELFRMYTRYADKQGWKFEVMESSPTELGGFKEIIFKVDGKGAYKNLKFESGVHRVQRVPTTEAGGRIHTSTVSVAVLPEAEEIDLEIRPDELKIDTFRASGPGGQHMQKTESAIRITHLPSGLVVTCQEERSQIKNKLKAMSILRARLLVAMEEKQRQKDSEDRKSQIGTGDRSEKIRTYNYPQNRITDHRINFNSHNLTDVLEGNIDKFIEALSKDMK